MGLGGLVGPIRAGGGCQGAVRLGGGHWGLGVIVLQGCLGWESRGMWGAAGLGGCDGAGGGVGLALGARHHDCVPYASGSSAAATCPGCVWWCRAGGEAASRAAPGFASLPGSAAGNRNAGLS